MTGLLKYRHLHLAVFAAGICLSFLGAQQSYHLQIEKNRELFDRMVRRNHSVIEEAIQRQTETLRIIGSYFLSSKLVHSDEFRIFTQSFINEGKSTDALGWITVRPEKTPRQHHTYTLSHTASGRDGRQSPSPLPIPVDSTLGSMAEQSLQNRNESFFLEERPVLAAPGKGNTDNLRLIAMYPTYHLQSGRLEGISFMIVDIAKLVETAISPVATPYVSMMAGIRRPERGNLTLYRSDDYDDKESFYHTQFEIPLGNQTLTLSFSPTAHFLEAYRPWNAYFAFAGLLLLFSLLALYVRSLTIHMHNLRRAREKAEEASRLKNEFLATMSHEIRSPMSGILGMAELLIRSQQPSDQREYTQTILNSGETLMNVIEDILDFSKIEANRMDLDPVPVNMLEIVDDVCALYAVQAREKALELAVRYVPGSEQFVYADPVRVRQILGNLVNNAIKFTQKGHVTVTVREDRTPGKTDPHTNLVFAVDDTGIGISRDAQQRIFEKFVQADASTTRNFGGTGLGLSICKRLIEMMGGELSVVSTPGKGSTFTFNLRLIRNHEETFIQARPPVLKDLKVLVVDDLAVIRTLVSEQLSMAGMRCASTASGEDALVMMHKAASVADPYRVVLIDYLLPGMNGEMLARAISDEPLFRNTCLIMLTSAGNPVAGNDFARKGFSGYISKPVRAHALVEALAIIWGQYREGATDRLIRVDAQTLGGDRIAGDEPRLENAKVLLAEDSRINQAFAQDVLEQMGCEVTVVQNGQDAISMLRSAAFDLVLMDCQMPVLDGFEASRHIRALKARGVLSKDLPVIALTANAMRGDRRKCIEAGMDDYLAKPVRTRELKEKVYYWITRENVDFADQHNERPAGTRVSGSDADPGDAEDNLLDQDAVAEAHRVLKDKYDTMVDYYIEDVAEYIHNIEQAFARKDLQGVIRPAHTIKSASQRMGARLLSLTAMEIEQAAQAALNENREWKSADMSGRLERISAIFDDTRHSLLRHRKSAASGA